VRERLITVNPVTVTRVPRSHTTRTEMYPFGEDDLERLWERASEKNRRLADLVLLAAWTGLRWSELRAIRVRDFVELPMPMLIVQRAEPEGVATKGTKSGKTRRVPVADRVLPIVRELVEGQGQDALLCATATGHQLHATALKRTLGWTTIADGRRIHDLRHTAACLWLARGVDPATVRRGWATRRSPPPICTCITLALHPTAPDWPGSTSRRGAYGVHRETRPQNHRSLSQQRICRLT